MTMIGFQRGGLLKNIQKRHKLVPQQQVLETKWWAMDDLALLGLLNQSLSISNWGLWLWRLTVGGECMVIESEVVEGLWNLQEFTWLSFSVQLHLFFYSWYHHWFIAIFLLVDENVTCTGEIQCRHGSLLLQWNAVWLLESWVLSCIKLLPSEKKEVEDC